MTETYGIGWLIDRARWSALRHASLLWWFPLFLWLSFGVRATLTTDLTLAGSYDDLAFVAFGVAAMGLTGLVTPPWRLGIDATCSLIILAAVLIDTLHVRFFGSYLNVEDTLVIGEMGAAAGSVLSLVTIRVVLFGIVIPLGLSVLAMRGVMRFRRRRPTVASAALLAAGVVALALHSASVGGLASAAYNNPVMLFARQLSGSSLAGEELSEAETWRQLRDHARDVYNWPDEARWRYGEWPGHPLLKMPRGGTHRPAHKPNVVIVVMESVRAYETAMGLGRASVTPNLDRLAASSLTVSDYYMVGHQTVRGEGAVLCSTFTHFGGAPIYVRYANVRIACLPELLRDAGYTTHWISSFRKSYFNKEGFLSDHGVEHFHDMSDYHGALQRHRIGWGPSDEDMMDYAVRVLNDSPQPFFASIMTLSNHHPFDHAYPIPDPPGASDPSQSTLYRNYLRGLHYTDEAVGHLMREAREQPWFDDTIFVVTGDHGARTWPAALDTEALPVEQTELFHRGILLIRGPGVTPGQLRMVASQVDVAPTLLDLIGLRAPNAFMGVSLVGDTPADERFAVFASATEWSVRQGNRYCYAMGVSCLEDGWPACPPGVAGKAAAHTCFETDLDLIRTRDARVGPSMHLLSGADADALLTRGERAVEFTNFLLDEDAIFPYPAQMPDGT